MGDVGRLRTDLKANVADAFDQARRASQYIQTSIGAEFHEKATGRRLVLNHDDIERTYLMTASLHHLAGIATQLASVKDLGLFRDGEYPWAISVADLELVCEFCPGPDVFLHYVERRLALQKESIHIHADEIDLFGAYLKTRLQASWLWDRGGKIPDWISLGGFQEPFDAVMEYKRGDRKESPHIRLEIPEKIDEILQELRRRGADANARWIAYSLLSLSDRTLDAVAAMFRDSKSQSPLSGSFRRVSHTEGNLVISLVTTMDHQSDSLRINTGTRTLLEKYRRKCTRSIGFGINLGDPSNPFDCAIWVESPWVHDPEMERILESEPAPLLSAGSRIPGRNEPCVCGSTKKFKKCCLSKIEAAKRS